MDGMCDQFFSGAGFAENENGGATACNREHLLEHLLQSWALAHNFPEMYVVLNLALKIFGALAQALLQQLDLRSGKMILQGEGKLIRYLGEQNHVLGNESLRARTAQHENPHGAPGLDHRNTAHGVQALRYEAAGDITVKRLQFGSRKNDGGAYIQSLFRGTPFSAVWTLRQQSLAEGKVQGVRYQVVFLRVVEQESRHFMVQNSAQISRHPWEQGSQIPVGRQKVIDVRQGMKAIHLLVEFAVQFFQRSREFLLLGEFAGDDAHA